MSDPVLSLRELNRATLARQMLLARETSPVTAAVERLVGLQAQLPRPPFIGLWTRLREFRREALADAIDGRDVVRATFMRATLHLITAGDYVRLRSALRPALTRAWSGIAKQRGGAFDLDVLLAAAERFIGEAPRTFKEISAWAVALMPGYDVGAMRYAVRTHLPLVQVPAGGGWSYPSQPAFTLAEPWIGRSVEAEAYTPELVRRYLAAFGPASVADMQTWSGLTGLKATFEGMKPELRRFRDERRRELFDLPDAPRPEADAPAPVRFLPEFDNLLLSHAQRTRVVADEHRPRVFLPALHVAATFLVDGFVGGTWTAERKRSAAALRIEPFQALARQDRAALAEEGERLIRFIEPDAGSFDVRFVDAGG